MRINFILPHLARPSGGIRVVLELSRWLQAQGHTVKIVYPVAPYRMASLSRGWRGIVWAGVESIRRLFPGGDVTSFVEWYGMRDDIVRVPSLSRSRLSWNAASRIPDADISIATAWQTAYTVDQLPPSKARKKFYFVQHYEIWPVWNSSALWNSLPKDRSADPAFVTSYRPDNDDLRRYKRLVDDSYRLPLQRITTSSWLAGVLRALDCPAESTVNYGVNRELFYPSCEPHSSTVLALHRSNPHKGDQDVIVAMCRIHDERPDADLRMFGPSRPENLPSFIRFHESPSQKEIRDLYSRASLLLYASWVEGYGMPPMEAMACRTAVVSTDVGAVRDISPESYGPVFVQIRNPQGLADTALQMLSKPRYTHFSAERCYRHIEKFTWKDAGREFAGALAE